MGGDEKGVTWAEFNFNKFEMRKKRSVFLFQRIKVPSLPLNREEGDHCGKKKFHTGRSLRWATKGIIGPCLPESTVRGPKRFLGCVDLFAKGRDEFRIQIGYRPHGKAGFLCEE